MNCSGVQAGKSPALSVWSYGASTRSTGVCAKALSPATRTDLEKALRGTATRPFGNPADGGLPSLREKTGCRTRTEEACTGPFSNSKEQTGKIPPFCASFFGAPSAGQRPTGRPQIPSSPCRSFIKPGRELENSRYFCTPYCSIWASCSSSVLE